MPLFLCASADAVLAALAEAESVEQFHEGWSLLDRATSRNLLRNQEARWISSRRKYL
jgi:hypothetical protein